MRTRSLTVAAATAAALATVVLTAPAAVSEDANLSATVQNVTAKVSRAGGLTVSGTMNCAAAVSGQQLPPNTRLLANVNWTAYQASGRHKMVTATWQSDIAHPCYDTNQPADQLFPWNTAHFNSSSTDFYVFSPDGKFVKGPVHLDIRVEGGTLETDGVPDGTVDVYSITGFDVRATR